MRATTPLAIARSDSKSSSSSLSTLKSSIPASSAASISQICLPTPENTTRPNASGHARRTRSSSPPETISKPQPSPPSSFRIASEEFAFTA